MLKELIARLKTKKEIARAQMQNYPVHEVIEEEPIKGEITVSCDNNIYKVVITGNVSISDYKAKRNSSEEYSVLDKICAAVLMNGSGISQGTYYVIETENCLYNILINGRKVIIHERERKTLDEDEKQIMRDYLVGEDVAWGEYFVQDRSLAFTSNNNDYSFSCLRHRQDGDTYYTKYYSKTPTLGFGKLELSDREAYDEIKSVIERLEEIDGINGVLDMDLLNAQVLEDLKNKVGVIL